MGSAIAKYQNPDVEPGPYAKITFDPNFGFPEGREKRVMIASETELKSAKIPLEDRDYCAHLLLEYAACRRRVFPFMYQCHHDKHTFLHCEYEDYVLRMKEYERERRLREREQRLGTLNVA